jgi:chaperonin cofactor prefoldin
LAPKPLKNKIGSILIFVLKNGEISSLNARKDANNQAIQRVENQKRAFQVELKQKTKAEKDLQRRSKKFENDLRNLEKKIRREIE